MAKCSLACAQLVPTRQTTPQSSCPVPHARKPHRLTGALSQNGTFTKRPCCLPRQKPDHKLASSLIFCAGYPW
jgi:hypothetical protein